MSTIVTAECWPIQIPPTQKAVLISLADNANDHGVCWPALDTIQMRTCLARSTVIEAIKWLEAHGLLAAQRIPGKSTRYQVIPNGKAPQLFDAGGRPSEYRTGPRGRPVQQVDQSGSRTGPRAGRYPSGSRTQPVQQPDPNRKEPSKAGISPGGRELNEPSSDSGEFVQDRVGQFEGHPEPKPGPGVPTEAGRIAVDLRKRGYRLTSRHPDLLAAVDEGVTLEEVAEFADLYPPDHPRSRGSPGYVLSATRRQRAENQSRATTSTTPVPRGTHDRSQPSGRESAADRALSRAREISERTGVDLGVG